MSQCADELRENFGEFNKEVADVYKLSAYCRELELLLHQCGHRLSLGNVHAQNSLDLQHERPHFTQVDALKAANAQSSAPTQRSMRESPHSARPLVVPVPSEVEESERRLLHSSPSLSSSSNLDLTPLALDSRPSSPDTDSLPRVLEAAATDSHEHHGRQTIANADRLINAAIADSSGSRQPMVAPAAALSLASTAEIGVQMRMEIFDAMVLCDRLPPTVPSSPGHSRLQLDSSRPTMSEAVDTVALIPMGMPVSPSSKFPSGWCPRPCSSTTEHIPAIGPLTARTDAGDGPRAAPSLPPKIPELKLARALAPLEPPPTPPTSPASTPHTPASARGDGTLLKTFPGIAVQSERPEEIATTAAGDQGAQCSTPLWRPAGAAQPYIRVGGAGVDGDGCGCRASDGSCGRKRVVFHVALDGVSGTQAGGGRKCAASDGRDEWDPRDEPEGSLFAWTRFPPDSSGEWAFGHWGALA